MQDLQQATIDISRRYLHDKAPTLSKAQMDSLNGWIRSRALKRLSTASDLFDPALQGSDSMRTLMQVEAFFSKNKSFTEPGKARTAALSSFWEGERRCRITNKRLDYYSLRPHRMNGELAGDVERARLWVHDTLGHFDEFVQALPGLIRITSGASANAPRSQSAPPMKVKARRLECTPRAWPIVEALSRHYGYHVTPKYVQSNRIAFVPKSWKTERTIACEPVANLPLQLAFDRYAKDRLRKRGINLSSQLRNQELARIGSLDGSYATLDLKGASDSLSISTVAWLLPDDWFDYLNRVRSKHFKLEGELSTYAKFSSMGNGATFALETLVFAAACASLTNDFSVYGDDIILPPALAGRLERLLRFLGFRLNPEKSHVTGPFRESCGANWFKGQDVTPFYLREWRRSKIDYCHNVNGLVSVSTPCGTLMEWCADIVAHEDLPFVPQVDSTIAGIFLPASACYSRGYLTSLRKVSKRPSKDRPDYQTPLFRGFVAKTRSTKDVTSRGLFLWHLAKAYCRPDQDHLSAVREVGLVPSAVSKYLRRWTAYRPATWDGSGPTGKANRSHLYWWLQCLEHRKVL